MTESQNEGAIPAAANDTATDPSESPKSPGPDTAEAAAREPADKPSTPDASAAPSPSPFLFADAERMYKKEKPADPPPAAPAAAPEAPAPDDDLEIEVAPLPWAPPPPPPEMLAPLAPPKRLTLPPSPLGPPPRPSVRAPAPPAAHRGFKLLIALGATGLVALVAFVAVLLHRWEPPHPQTPTSAAEPETTSPPSETDLTPTPVAYEPQVDDSANGPDARSHRRREGGSGAGAHANPTARNNPASPAAPMPEQIAMAIRSIRGPILMCGLSRPANGPDNCEVTLSFNGSGHVTSATIGAPYAGTPFGSCVASAARRMTVPPFGSAVFRTTQSIRCH